MVIVGIAAVVMNMPVGVFAEDAILDSEKTELTMFSNVEYDYWDDDTVDLFDFNVSDEESCLEDEYSLIDDKKIATRVKTYLCIKDYTPVFASPKRDSNKIGIMHAGEKITGIMGNAGVWVRGDYHGSTGYILAENLRG